MSAVVRCRCGHAIGDHTGITGPCRPPTWTGLGPCDCLGFDDPDRIKPGERLEFGRHRIAAKDAETAPAWPSLAKWGAAMRRRSLGR